MIYKKCPGIYLDEILMPQATMRLGFSPFETPVDNSDVAPLSSHDLDKMRYAAALAQRAEDYFVDEGNLTSARGADERT